MGNFYIQKDCGLQLKEVDEAKRFVAGYLSAFGNVDSDRDMIMPGAYRKTVAERGPSGSNRIKYLWQHDSWKPIGNFTKLQEDSTGLYFEAEVVSTTWGDDAMKLIAGGVLNEHSVGYQVIKENRLEEYTELIELKLWEGSVVTWGANDRTPFTEIKAMSKEQVEAKLAAFNRKHEAIVAQLRKGSLTNETYEQLEVYLKQIQQQYNDMALAAAAEESQQKNGEPLTEAQTWAAIADCEWGDLNF